MELIRTWLDEASDPAMVRACAEVAYDNGARGHEVYWVDLPRRYANDITTTANPWAVGLLPLAATLGEPLRLRLPLDPILFSNLKQLLRVWHSWYPALSVVPVVADMDRSASSEKGGNGRTVALFSGGLDSFFTLLRDREADGEPPVDDLLSIWGFDVPLTNPDAFQRMRPVLQNVANASGKELVTAATNLRQTGWATAAWGPLAHGCGLACVALLLERRWTRVLIASSYGYAHLHPWGSHALTDPLLSTGRTAVVHDGAASNRVEKTRIVAQSAIAMRSLRVCWRSRTDHNCGACEKCYRTMTTLWLLGALDTCSTFAAGSFDPDKINRIFCRGDGCVVYMREIRQLALETGHGNVVRAVDRALARSRRLLRVQAALTRLRQAAASSPASRASSWLLDRVEWRVFRNVLR
jgi:hypothetical protein